MSVTNKARRTIPKLSKELSSAITAGGVPRPATALVPASRSQDASSQQALLHTSSSSSNESTTDLPTLRPEQLAAVVRAIKPINRGKNRYSNVLPLEKTRVKLRPKNHAEGSDYINANWVDGLIPGSERAYITTQGPLQETVEDFWRMISETGSNVIVMLTKEVENDKIKCTHYWPLEPGNAFTFDTLRVTLVSEEKTFENRLVERTLELHHPDTGDRREIKHYQYLDWPDHGLPESAAAFRKILHKVDRVRAEQSPIVVHCSAGIGRTGTFCTVHSTLEKLHLHLKEKPDEPPEFNVLQTVLRMREQRVGMVQTKEQYIFCYKALLEETQKLGLTSVTADHLV